MQLTQLYCAASGGSQMPRYSCC